MRFLNIIIIVAMITGLQACGGAETKVDTEDSKNVDTASMQDNSDRPSEEKLPETTAPSGTVNNPAAEEKHKILRNIDKHLVSTQTASDRVTVENTLPDASFQRVIVEVNELDGAGKITRTNFYQVINLDPGSKKVVKITAPAPSAKVDLHIVKAKSNELTGGAMILVGARYSEEQ